MWSELLLARVTSGSSFSTVKTSERTNEWRERPGEGSEERPGEHSGEHQEEHPGEYPKECGTERRDQLQCLPALIE